MPKATLWTKLDLVAKAPSLKNNTREEVILSNENFS